jgi:rhodanese-related sulfurtransferase
MEPERITVEKITEREEQGENFVFVDSRSVNAWGTSSEQIPGSIRIPPNDARLLLDRIPKEGTIVTYCT